MTPADVLDVAFTELGRAVIVAGHYAFFTAWGWFILPVPVIAWCVFDGLRSFDNQIRESGWREGLRIWFWEDPPL